MKICVLVPYCPWPVTSGAKAEIVKHLEILRELGDCVILSAAGKPVGAGWRRPDVETARQKGFGVVLRETDARLDATAAGGLFYAGICKTLRLERAFGHANPYHRYAFRSDWWRRQVAGADLAVVNYSYWAWLPCPCPKAVVLLDLLSTFMWGGARRETRDLAPCRLVQTVSLDEQKLLHARGLNRTWWSPPAIEALEAPLSAQVGLVGSANPMNREGLRWLARAATATDPAVRVYGSLARHATRAPLVPVGSYERWTQPYERCGIILLPTCLGMGVQIKAIEALAAGRAIVARRGALRGLPTSADAWIEVTEARDLWCQARRLAADPELRARLGQGARAFYRQHLDRDQVRRDTRRAYEHALQAE